MEPSGAARPSLHNQQRERRAPNCSDTACAEGTQEARREEQAPARRLAQRVSLARLGCHVGFDAIALGDLRAQGHEAPRYRDMNLEDRNDRDAAVEVDDVLKEDQHAWNIRVEKPLGVRAEHRGRVYLHSRLNGVSVPNWHVASCKHSGACTYGIPM